MNDLVAKLRSSIPSEALGVEIGAHSLPIEGLTPYYIDRVAQFAGTNGVVDILADACALPLRSESLDYLCSSHVLEHLSEPLTSLWEWHRVLRRGGFLYLVVPDKRFTFDHTRKVTDTSHHLEEFLHGSSVAASREHIRQFIYDTDWARLQPASVAENAKVERDAHYQHWVSVLSSGEGLDIHYHTFTPDSLVATLRAAGFIGGLKPAFDVVGTAERHPAQRGDGIGMLLRRSGGDSGSPSDCETFVASNRRARTPNLQLVCPATLAPLRFKEGRLNVLGYQHHYELSNEIPCLITPSSVKVRRRWNSRIWRRLTLFKARF